MKRFVLPSVLLVLACVALAQETSDVILDMDAVVFKPNQVTVGKDKEKVDAGTVELVDGRSGKACRFTFIDNARAGFFQGPALKPTAAWDAADGFSFYVKGDGSKSWGGIELINDDFKGRYAVCFPIDSTEWTKITVPWCDVIPELPSGDLVDASTGFKPSSFRYLWFGKWFYWQRYPAHAFAIDQVALEKDIRVDATDYTPAQAGCARVLAKLKAKRPVTIVTMGDSLSDKNHWANKQQLWSEMLVEDLKRKFDCEVKLVNPAIGGTQLSQNLILMPRWIDEAPEPDLVTVWFGYNDWDSGMRGPRFEKFLRFAVDRIRRMTKGKADIILMTTCPANKRWHDMDELAEAVRKVAAEKKTALADVAAAFHEVEGDDADTALKLNYWAWDKTHLGPKGHETAKETVLKTLEE